MSGKVILGLLAVGTAAAIAAGILASIRDRQREQQDIDRLKKLNRDLDEMKRNVEGMSELNKNIDNILRDIKQMDTELWMEENQERVKHGLKPILKLV